MLRKPLLELRFMEIRKGASRPPRRLRRITSVSTEAEAMDLKLGQPRPLSRPLR